MQKTRVFWRKIIVIAAAVLVPAAVFAGPASVIEFVDAAGVDTAVFSDPSIHCQSRLPAWELSVVEGTYNRFSAKRANVDCREAFSKVVRDFTDEEKAVLMRYVTRIDSVASVEFPVLNHLPWCFVVISDTFDLGVPNIGRYVILTKGILKEMQEWAEKQSSMFFVGMEMLIREKTLLLQNNRRETCEKFYAEVWGFRKIPELSIDRLMQDNGIFFSRVPPNEWVIKLSPKDKEYIMPALLLRDAGKGKGGGGTAQRVAISIDSTSKGFFPRKSKKSPIDYRDLRHVSHYRKKFPLSEYDYHPVEISADLLTKYVVMKYVSAHYGTAPTKISEYSQIEVLMKMLWGAGAK
ncbi:MAG: hypothetical protein LBC59_00600 [Chitinispirillales bacterium]|jgi:hypothetical protein|nr:hypothetical protein [Chitinispirillales bacterium]